MLWAAGSPRSLYPAFLQQIEPQAKAATPLKLMTPGQARTADELIDDAVHGGARLLAERPATSDHERFLPAVLADVTPDMAICRRDSFAPIMAVLWPQSGLSNTWLKLNWASKTIKSAPLKNWTYRSVLAARSPLATACRTAQSGSVR